MTLENIISKQSVIDTPTARALAENPQEYEERFAFHVETHVTVADLGEKWDKMFRNLEQRKSVTGLIYADTGYGKTSTAASLWRYAESRDFVAVPPFMWASMTDMLLATHGWSRFRLTSTRPDLIPALDQRFESLMQSGLGDLSARLAREQNVSIEDAQRIVEHLSQEGHVSDVISANRLISFLEFATNTLCEAGFKGLLLLPDEFELFENTNSDIAKNFAQLKEFIFPLFQMNIPLGCVVITYSKTQAEINQREPYMSARFNKPEGSLINLATVYGNTSDGRRFPEVLWEKLAIQGNLSRDEQMAISHDVLVALGQFLAHPRSTSLLSGPRSVVTAFRRAALHYRSTGSQYTIFNFCDDYLNSGMICYNQQEIDTLRAYTSILGQGVIGDSPERKEIVQLLCVMPEGVPHSVFEAHGISDQLRREVVQALIGTHVITKPLGPTLLRYRDSSEGGDQMVEVLKIMRDHHNPGSQTTIRAAVRGFVNHMLPVLLNKRVGAAQTGWAGLAEMETDLEPIWTTVLKGTAHEFYPDRTLAVHVGDERHPIETGKYIHTDLFLRFVLSVKDESENHCQVSERGLSFVFHVGHCFDATQVPRAIGKLEDVFMPERVTPLLLLDMLDFFDTRETQVNVGKLKLDAQVKMLRSQIVNELTSFMFAESTKQSAVARHPSLAQIPIGKDMVERTLAVVTKERYPDYQAVAMTHQWVNMLERYRQILTNEERLGIRRGVEQLNIANSEVPSLFNVSSHITFRNTYYPNGVLRDLLRVDERDASGRIVERGIESSNSQKPVAVWFTPHPLEHMILQMLEASTSTLPGRDTQAIKVSTIFEVATQKGYLADEVEQLIKVLVARGLVAEEAYQGQDYLYLLKLEISIAELEQGVVELEEFDARAREAGFSSDWQPAHYPSQLRQRLVDPDTAYDEIAKDHLRRDIREAKNDLARSATQWLKKAFDSLLNAEKNLGVLKSEPPKALEQSTGHPTTEFSTLLFMDIRGQILSNYTKHNAQIKKTQEEIQERLRAEKLAYDQEKSIPKAIETANRLTQYYTKIDSDTENIEATRKSVNDLYLAYQKWRDLARRIEEQRLIFKDLSDDPGVQALLQRLDDEQGAIKRHLADRNQSVVQVLDDYEHFANRISEIVTEFDDVAKNREQKFLTYQSHIYEQLKEILPSEPQAIKYNSRDDEGGYRDVNTRAMEHLQQYCDRAVKALNNVQVELLKPLEVFQVDTETKSEAERLSNDVRKVKQDISHIRSSMDSNAVYDSVGGWVNDLKQASEGSSDLLQRHNRIMDRLRTEREQLSDQAQSLLTVIENGTKQDLTELIISLRGNATSGFESASQIIIYLEELYQRNWINIQVTPTSGR